MVNEVTFVCFKGNDRPNPPPGFAPRANAFPYTTVITPYNCNWAEVLPIQQIQLQVKYMS